MLCRPDAKKSEFNAADDISTVSSISTVFDGMHTNSDSQVQMQSGGKQDNIK